MGSGALTVTQTSDTTFAGVITGRGNLIKTGANSLTLSNNNTHAGDITISAGTLTVIGTLSDGADVVVNGGVYNVDANDTVASISGLGGSINIASEVTLTDKGNSKTYAGAIAGDGTFRHVSGNLTLSGTNTVANVTITGGTVDVTGTLADTAAVSVSSGAVYKVSNTDTVGSITGAGFINLESDQTLSTGSTASTFSGTMRGAGSFEKVGAATLTLSGVNNYTGTTTITGGTLTLADNAANILPDQSAITLANTAGVILNINGKSAETIGTLSGGGANGGNITLGDGNLTINNRANTIYSGVISGSGSVTKIGSTTLTLEGVNTYTGITTINAGKIKVGVDSALPSTAVTLSSIGQLTIENGFSQTIGNLTSASANSKVNLVGSGALTVTQTSDTTFAGYLYGDGAFTKEGSGSLTLSAAAGHKGLTQINNGTLALAEGSIIGAVTLANTVGAKLDVNGNQVVINTLTGYANSAIDLGTDGTLIIYQLSNSEYQGSFTGNGILEKRGNGSISRLGSAIKSGRSNVN